jgi:CYTH domain-containing protein
MRLRRMFNSDNSVLATKLTQKYVDKGQPPEDTTITNTYLNEAEYELFSRLPGNLLVKRRTPYLHQGSGYSIDVFEGPLAGLILAELEAGQGSLPPGAVPAFAVTEVTAERSFTGGELVHTSAEELASLLESWLTR